MLHLNRIGSLSALGMLALAPFAMPVQAADHTPQFINPPTLYNSV